MKKILWYMIAALGIIAAFSSCKKNEIEEEDTSVATLKSADLIDAVAAAYAVWEDNTTIPASLKVGSTELTLPQYQYAICKLLTNLAAGDKSDVKVYNYKAASKPENDSYDQKEIAVKGGAQIKEGTEDIVDIAKRMIASMEEKLTVPNSTLVTRGNEKAIAFSTNRATITILRTIAEYKKGGALPDKVSTEYLSAAASLKGFAEQFVKILEIWDKTVGTVSADGSHCTDNNSAWQEVHFVPIPHSGGAYADGKDQYDAKYQPYFTVTIDGKEYTSAQTWGIALRGIVDMITTEGSAKMQQNRNPFEHTMGNGASLKEPIPAVYDYDIWGQYPWYESTNDGPAINLTEFSPYLIARCATWFLTRQVALGKIGNYQYFCTDPDTGFVEDGIEGFVSSMRMWLIAARFYKYLLDNNITENVYDAVKNVKFDTDLYGVEMPDIELKTKTVELDDKGAAQKAKFNAKKDWTATASDAWITVEPASGAAGSGVEITVTAEPNTGAAREGEILIKGGNVTDGLAIAVKQAKYVDPSTLKLKDFAVEFVKGLDVWAETVGTVESEGKHLIEKGTAWENVHYIPIGHTGGPYDSHAGNQYDETLHPAWTMTVNGETYTSAQALEIAIRGLFDMVLSDGQDYIGKMTSRNKPGYTLADHTAFSEVMAVTPSDKAKWGNYPFYEYDDSFSGLTYNGQPVTECGVDLIVKATLGHLVRGLVGIPGVFGALGNFGNFQQFGTTDDVLILEGYEGLIAPMRELVVLMRIYKYLLDNNIDQNVYTAIKDVKFDYDMYHQGEPAVVKTTLKDFATEFVKGLDVWEATVGTVESEGKHLIEKGTAWENVHFIPVGKTGGEYDNHSGNQHDAKWTPWTLTVGGQEYTSAQAWEIAVRGLLDMVLTDGQDYIGKMTSRNKPGYTHGDNKSFSEITIATPSEYAIWGQYPWYEEGGVTYNGEPLTEVGIDVITKATLGHLVRGIVGIQGAFTPLKKIGNYQEFGTTDDVLILEGYKGLISPMRELILMMRVYKYLLDNNIDQNVYTAIKDVKFDYDMYHQVKLSVTPFKVQWEMSADAARASDTGYAQTFGGEDEFDDTGKWKGAKTIKDSKPGDGGKYVNSNILPGGKITFVQVDKTQIDTLAGAGRSVGESGHPYITGAWPGDYWLFTATNNKKQPAGAKVHIAYVTRCSGTGQKYWMVEYLDGTEWKPAPGFEVTKETETGKNIEYNFEQTSSSKNKKVDVTYTTTADMEVMQFRMRCVANYTLGSKVLDCPNTGTCRIAGKAAAADGSTTSPVFEVIE